MHQNVRCFVAIDLPEEVKNELKRLQLEIKKSGGDLKASFTKNFHITLKFLGDLTPQKVESVKESLGNLRLKRMEAVIDSIGVFPSESRIRVVWAGVEPEDEILKLQKDVDEALQKDFKKEKDFKAHITLARVKHVGDKGKFIRILKGMKVEKAKFEVNEFKLKRSILTEEGPVYEDLAVYA